jgi:hypothetical protein
MLPKHFYAMADGYLTKEYKHESALRKLGFWTILPYTKKDRLSFIAFCTDYWPLPLDDEHMEKPKSPLQDLTEEERKEEFMRVMKMHNPKRYNEMMREQNSKQLKNE